MKTRIFTFLVAFLATMSGAVWGQNGSAENPIEINISFMTDNGGEKPTNGNGYSISEGTKSELGDKDQSNILTINSGGYYKLIGSKSNIQIKVTATDNPVYITVASGIHIDASMDNNLTNPKDYPTEARIWSGRCAMEISANATVILDWEGNCELASSGNRAGINVKPDATLILAGPDDATLTGTSWNNETGVYTCGAGIGGDSLEPNFGTIIIESGQVAGRCYAQQNGWYAYGAGIGGGFKLGTEQDQIASGTGSTKGTIIIKGGIVTTETNYSNTNPYIESTGKSAGIGGSYKGTCSNITITGGTINQGKNQGTDIGNGMDYTSPATSPELIIAPAEKDKAPNIQTTDIVDSNNSLVVKDGASTLEGAVTLPKGADQIYAPKIGNEGTLNAYSIKLKDSKITEDGNESHTVDGLDDIKNATTDMFYSPGATINVTSNVSCSKSHIFIGWLKKENNTSSIIEPTGEASDLSATFNIPTNPVTSNKQEAFTITPVWVDNEQPILAQADVALVGDPDISVVPSEAVSLLTFELDKSNADGRLNDVSFKTDAASRNVLEGIPTLKPEDNGFAKFTVKANVSVKDNENSKIHEVNLPFTAATEINASVTAITSSGDHTYNGNLHNGTTSSGNEEDHWFTITATSHGESVTLREGTHYRIKSCTYKSFADNATEETLTAATGDDKATVELKAAGTYRNFELEGLAGTTFTIGDVTNATTYTFNESIAIKQAELTWTSSYTEVEYTAGEAEPTWSNLVTVSGKIGNDDVSATLPTPTISGETSAWKTKPGKYTVTFAKATTLTGNEAKNYTMTKDLELTLIVKGSVDNVDIKPGTNSPWNMAGDGTFSHVYDGTIPEIGTLAITVAGVDEPVILTEDEDFTVDYDNVAKDVKEGGYTATITFKENDYIITDDTEDVTLYITARPLNITFKDKVASIDGLTVADLVVPDNLVSGEIPNYSGTITSEETGENTYKVTITGFKIEDSGTFTRTNYAIKVNNEDYADDKTIVIDKVTVDPDNDDHQGGIWDGPTYYNIYVDTCQGVWLERSTKVVREGNSVRIKVEIEEGTDTTNLELKYKRGLFGYWEDLTLHPTENPDEYLIKNIYDDIYVLAKGAVPTGIEDIDGVQAKVYSKDGSIYVQTPKQEQVLIISISGAIVKNEKQIGLQRYDGLQRGVYVVKVGKQVFKIRN